MTFRRVSAVAGTLVLGLSLSVSAAGPGEGPAPPRNSRESSAMTSAKNTSRLSEVVDAVAAGKQPAPADVKLKFQHHFLKSNENIYIPVHVEVEPAEVHVVSRRDVRRACAPEGAAAAAAAGKGIDGELARCGRDLLTDEERDRPLATPTVAIQRALELPAGDYTMYGRDAEKQRPRTRRCCPRRRC